MTKGLSVSSCLAGRRRAKLPALVTLGAVVQSGLLGELCHPPFFFFFFFWGLSPAPWVALEGWWWKGWPVLVLSEPLVLYSPMVPWLYPLVVHLCLSSSWPTVLWEHLTKGGGCGLECPPCIIVMLNGLHNGVTVTIKQAVWGRGGEFINCHAALTDHAMRPWASLSVLRHSCHLSQQIVEHSAAKTRT